MINASARPVIALSGTKGDNRLARFCIRLGIRIAGGTPLEVFPGADISALSYDGVLISGGVDIHPARYGDMPKPHYAYREQRDELELALIQQADKEHIPILGICRGAQLMNIYRGGNLHMDVSKAFEKANYPNGTIARILYRKYVDITPESLLSAVIGRHGAMVNSIHSQAVHISGAGLRITARERNGVPQALEDNTHPFFLGVQFHPEYMQHRTGFRRIFSGLVDAARKRRDS